MASSKPWNVDIETSRDHLRDFLLNGRPDSGNSRATKALISPHDEEKVVAEQAAHSPLTEALWKLHPSLTVVREIEPVVNAVIRRNPFTALALGALAGGALVFAKPWRRINVGALTAATIGTTSTTALASAALTAMNQYAKKT